MHHPVTDTSNNIITQVFNNIENNSNKFSAENNLFLKFITCLYGKKNCIFTDLFAQVSLFRKSIGKRSIEMSKVEAKN